MDPAYQNDKKKSKKAWKDSETILGLDRNDTEYNVPVSSQMLQTNAFFQTANRLFKQVKA